MIDVTVYALWGLDENGNGVADVLENKALLVFRVVNGTWADGSHGDKTVVVLLEDGKGTLSNADVPTGMKPNQNYTNGHWDQTPDTTVGSISGNHTYTYLYDTAASVPSTRKIHHRQNQPLFLHLRRKQEIRSILFFCWGFSWPVVQDCF